jgi:hypothetical protein
MWILAAAVALGALPSAAMAQFIGSDGSYSATRTSGNTFNSIIGVGNTTLLGSGDDVVFPFTFGTPFTYYGVPQVGGNATTNALITFGGANNNWVNDTLANPIPGSPLLAPYWDDLLSSAAGQGVYLQTAGNTTTLEWNTGYFGQTGTAAFQAVFNSATGSIRFNYGDISTGAGGHADAGSATVGIKGAATFVQAGFNTAGTVVSGDSILITPVGVPEPGTMTLCGLAIAGGLAKYRRRKA